MEKNRKYDMLILLSPELDRGEVEKIADRYAEAAVNNGAKVVKRSFWGRKNLAYEVNGYDKGNYYLFHLEASGDCVAELNRLLKISLEVMKFMIIRVEEFTDPFGKAIEEAEARANASPIAATEQPEATASLTEDKS